MSQQPSEIDRARAFVAKRARQALIDGGPRCKVGVWTVRTRRVRAIVVGLALVNGETKTWAVPDERYDGMRLLQFIDEKVREWS